MKLSIFLFLIPKICTKFPLFSVCVIGCIGPYNNNNNIYKANKLYTYYMKPKNDLSFLNVTGFNMPCTDIIIVLWPYAFDYPWTYIGVYLRIVK